MKGKLPIYAANMEIGTVNWTQDGMTYVFEANFQLATPPTALQTLYLTAGTQWVRLGIPEPCGNSNWHLKKRLSASTLRSCQFLLSNCNSAQLSSTPPEPPPSKQECSSEPPTAQSLVSPTTETASDTPSTETVESVNAPTDSASSWQPVTDLDAILQDTVLVSLLRGKPELIYKKSGAFSWIGMPYDLLDEIYLTPAFCLLNVIDIHDKHFFVLKLDENGWPIPPDTENSL